MGSARCRKYRPGAASMPAGCAYPASSLGREGDPKTATGTMHGTPYPYDTHVPLLVFGPNVKPGIRREEVVPASIASIFAKALGIQPPAKVEYPVPEGLFKD